MDGDTVVALATPPGESGIAVIRISGPEACAILRGMARAAAGWRPREVHTAFLRGSDGAIMDRAMAVFMKGPDSYTGEDVAEIFCHGSMHITSKIIEDAIARGAKPAGRGEFTKRAYLNGKMDLAQAEAVADLISSETELQGRVALAHLDGSLSGKIREIENVLLEHLALVEVSIDFSEEDTEPWDRTALGREAGIAAGTLEHLLESVVAGRKLREGIRITILGPRNAGKSSLYNALIGEERAIVSAVPGTTRDLLRERIHIGGITYFLEDTAGIGETGCEIEARGMSIGRLAASDADIVLLVLDGSARQPEGLLEGLQRPGAARHIVLLNKADLGLAENARSFSERTGEKDVLAVSALEGEGLEELRGLIFDATAGPALDDVRAERIALNTRQGAAVREAAGALRRVESLAGRGGGAELVAVELREAIEACGRVTGRSVAADLLERIFSDFCIGK